MSNGKLVLEKVNLVPQLCYNLLSVSKVCDKNLVVVFNNSECLFVKPDIQIPEEMVLMRAPRKHNTYLLDMNNPNASDTMTCLISKAT